MKDRYGWRLLAALLLALLLTGCAGAEEEAAAAAVALREGETVEKQVLKEDAPLRDLPELYEGADETSVVTLYLTVRSGNAADHTNHTWTEINSHSNYYYDENNLDRFNVEAILQVGDENGPVEGEFGYGEVVPNATVQVRGQSSSMFAQKNYKVRIKEGKGEYRGQRTLALNKHVSDAVRFTNKFAYDTIKEIPQMMGARTQFVHLYVKDETAGGRGAFEDYGLFTWVEQMNRTYLETHGMDRRGSLYKVNFFEWSPNEPVMRLKTDPDYDEKEFEEYLEIKGSDDHRKLQEVIEQLNDYSVPIEEIVEKHFDVENLCYWAAFHILIGNYDVGARNSYLYSPLNSDKFYVITWDSDASFNRTYFQGTGYSEGMSWERGLTQFTNLRVFDRMFKKEEYRQALDAAVRDLKEHYLTEEKVRARMERYAAVVKPYVFRYPDAAYARVSSQEYDALLAALPGEVELNYQYYLESLEKPWPFFVGTPEVVGEELFIGWDVAYDLDQEEITYDFTLSSDYTFQHVLAHEEDIRIPGVTVGMLEPGQYFIRVRARNASGYEQDCFDYYSVSGLGKVYGAKSFYVHRDGTVSDYVAQEGDG